MIIDINGNSVKKMVRMMRDLADELDKAVHLEQRTSKSKPKNVITIRESQDIQEVVDYYRSIHPTRGAKIASGHKEWKLICQRLRGDYSVGDLKKAILSNSKDPWWTERALNSVTDIMHKENNLQSFIHRHNNPKRGNDAKHGYTAGSTEFEGTEGFGD